MSIDLRAVLATAGLDEEQLARMAALLAALEVDDHAPTSVRDRDLAAYVHLADSLSALDVAGVREAGDIADLGSGAGFPGLALAVALPAASVALVESQRRKCEFLQRTMSITGIANARVVCARVEDWADGIGANDLVTARALAPQPVVLEYAAPLLRVGGTFVDWRGRRDEREELAAARAADELGMRREEVRRVEPFPGARDRHLHLFVKVGGTPDRFPRRAGVARKRPLGA
jgi:16S rRNA (guanine527-N7)-methyltransferase